MFIPSFPLQTPPQTQYHFSLSLPPVTTGHHNQTTPFRCLTKFQSLKDYAQNKRLLLDTALRITKPTPTATPKQGIG
ncbi:hypothetical protein RchiOBHm_Chr5g0078831 [Rosa chinensis]|uniref:Uncharacterized protein n=1 Tax=Rosa chinensis TaxID=74649 RepID=A0A2P6QMB2_ROSCH|nr:hypothetical protein RchiOBHm_Chr5g0078831 [Rosa chinensis]